jgi:ABC-2 type transport system ATP-binding protein
MDTVISIDSVTKQFGQQKVLKSISFQVNQGDIFGFLGPNGAGKTTTIRCIMDFIRPDSGRITLLGKDSHVQSVEIKKSIGYLPAENQLIEAWNAKQHIDFYSSIRNENSLRILKLVKKLEIALNVPVKHMSSGNRQKLSFLLALVGDPKLLILDEPTRGLDPIIQNDIYDILTNYVSTGGTVFISSHNLDEVNRICSNVGIIREGKIVADKSMNDIKNMKIHLITVSLNNHDRLYLTSTKNLEVVNSNSSKTILKVHGDINPVLHELSNHKLIDLEITHAPLEDVFMDYYRD